MVPFVGETFFCGLEISWNSTGNLHDTIWTRVCYVCAKFRLRLDKVFVILGKFINEIWVTFLQIWASLGKHFWQIRTFSNLFGQIRTCPNL